jgi:hypothetical protein
VLRFTPGSAAATSLNDEVQQLFANLIWSPFAESRNGMFGTGWLDVGIEYLWTRRSVFGGSAMTQPAGRDVGEANRILFATIARFWQRAACPPRGPGTPRGLDAACRGADHAALVGGRAWMERYAAASPMWRAGRCIIARRGVGSGGPWS